ncbi:MAG TPA: zincin-like metallopeptidase domain-containing protein [Bacillus sp. (in: firmicutes)]|nr:zincin-like metallopeptidase domain-containing protein [Bacillus sp. (in: firmicutes)]
MTKNEVYQRVTDRIISELKKGVVPWRRPWANKPAVSWLTQKRYRGINSLLLPPGEYATFKQVEKAGGRVKKGAKGNLVVYFDRLKIEDKDTGEEIVIPFQRNYTVFEINTQCEGLASKWKTREAIQSPLEEAEKIIKGYEDKPPIYFKSGRAFYAPALDYISVPPIIDYEKAEAYYSTIFHEMVHSTGHKSRLNREGIATMAGHFGSEIYSKEELVAEIGAGMLCAECGIDNSTLENSAAYIGGWLKALNNDQKLIFHAASYAQKAVDWILGIYSKQEEDVEVNQDEKVSR